jgi:antitoxin ParD1/3/4
MAANEDSDEGLENLGAKLAALDAAITRGLTDAEAGRVNPSSKVFDRLEAWLRDSRDHE